MQPFKGKPLYSSQSKDEDWQKRNMAVFDTENIVVEQTTIKATEPNVGTLLQIII